MHKSIFTLIAITLLSTSCFGQTSLLEEVPTLITNGTVSTYLCMPHTLMRKFGRTEMWVKEIANGDVLKFRKSETAQRKRDKLSTKGFDKLDHILSKVECDCGANKLRVVEMIYYDLNGEVIGQYENPTVYWANAVPESIGFELFKFACNK